MSFKKNTVEYFQSSFNEIKTVTWPTQKTLIKHSQITLLMVLVTAIFLGIIDGFFTKGLQYLIENFL